MSVRQLAMQAYLHVVTFALLAVGVVSLIGYLHLEHPTRHSIVLLPDSAVIAFLLGLCLLASIRGWRRLALAASGALLLLCAYGLAGNLWLADANLASSPLGAPLRMRSALALASVWLAAAILAGCRGRLGKGFCQASGLAILTAGLAAQLASGWLQLESLHLAFKPENTAIACLFILSLGAALLVLPRLQGYAEQSFGFPSLAAGALGSALTALLWYNLSQQNAESLTRQNALLLAQARVAIERGLESRLALVQRAAEGVQSLEPPVSVARWSRQSAGYLRDAPDLQLLGLLDEQLKPSRLQARHEDARLWLEAFLANPAQHDWLARVQLGRQPDISRAFLHRGDEAAVLIAVPLQPEQPSTRLLVAELNVAAMLRPMLDAQPHDLFVQIFEGQRQLFGPVLEATQEALAPVGELLVTRPHDIAWRLSSYRDTSGRWVAIADLPALVLLFGQTFSFLLMLSQCLARLTRERSEHLDRANNELKSSLQRQSQLQLLNQRIMTHSLDVLCSIDAQGRFTQVSPSSSTVFGYLPEEMIGRPYLDFVHLEDRQQAATELHAMVAGDCSQTLRHRCWRKDGSDVYILWSAAWSASDRSLFAVAHDITPQVQNEAFGEDQRDILSMVSTDQPLERTLTCICQMAETQQPAMLCAVMLVDPQRQQLSLGAGPSLPDDYRAQLNCIPIGPTAASCGTAVHQRRLVIVENIALDPLWRDYRAAALAHGLHACWSIPLISHKNDVLGSLALYHRRALEPDDAQLQLMATAGQLAAIAVARHHDRQHLQESKQRYRSLFTFNPNPVWSLDLSGKLQSMNQAGCELFGHTEQALLGQDFSMLLVAGELTRLERQFQAARQGEPQHTEARCRNHQGEELELELTNLPIKVDGQLVGIFTIAKDVGERNRMTQALRVALQHSEHQAELLRGLNESAVAMSRILDTQALLSFMAERLRSLIGTHQAQVSLPQHDGWAQSLNGQSLSDKYQAWTAATLDEEEISRMSDELDQPLLLSDAQLRAHPRWSRLCIGSDRQPPRRGWLAIPLKDPAGHSLGLLQLSDKEQGEFDRDDLAVAQHFTQIAVAVLENSRLMQAVMAGERRLKAQLGFTSAITNSTAEGLLAVGNQGLLTFVNPAAARLLGQSADHLLGQPLAEYLPLPLGDWPLANSEMDSRHGEFRLSDDGRDPLYMAFDSAPLLDGNTHSGWVVAIRDISAQRRADQAMRERDQFFTLSLEMFCIISLDGDFLQVNTAFQDELGYPQECLIGHSYLGLFHPQERPALAEQVRQLLAGAPRLDLELRALDARGRAHWLQLSAALGEDQLVYCAARNISARKAAEQALQDSLHELERSNRELQEFAFVASHDLQEPLRKIQTFSERLQAHTAELDEQGRDYLQRMGSAAERMQSLIRDLLAYSRVTSRGQAFQPVDLDRLLDEVLQDLEAALESSGARIERETLPRLLGDPTQLRQLLQNLLSNAIKFHREDEPPQIRVYAERQENGAWTLCVTDQGIGFDEKYLDRIFNPFQRLHGRQAYPGTGIGLAIVKKIVERHGARISASSCPGRGSTFRIAFMEPV